MSFYIFAVDGSGIAVFDLLSSETHGETCSVTEHNVEEGSPIADHVVVNSSTLSLSLGVTNTPMGPDPARGRGGPLPLVLDTPSFRPPFDGSPGSIFRAIGGGIEGAIYGQAPDVTTTSSLQFAPDFDRIAEVEQTMLDLKNGGKLVSVITSTRTYDDLVIERCEMTREKPGLAMFTVELKQIRFVATASVQAPKPLEPRGQPVAKKGQQTPGPPTEEPAGLKRSTLLSIASGQNPFKISPF